MNKLFLMILSLLLPLQILAQELKGNITDTDGLPVIGAAVMIEGTQNGVVSDFDGNFTISVSKGSTLRVSCIGYEDKLVSYNGEQEMHIVLNFATTALDEVVVVGYGEYSRRTISSAITKLNGDEISDLPVSSASEALKGKISGLHIVQTNNTPGGEFTMKIRGGSSITNSNEPLVFVDGVERSMAEINPNDIASIDVLKDAASAAIYGARGSNGVILVTTKKGSFGRAPKVTFEANLAYQEPETLREFLNAEDYISILRPAVAVSASPSWNYNSGWSASSGNTGSSIYSTRYYNEGDVLPEGWKTMTDPLDPNKTLMFCDTDWQSIMFHPAMWQNYYIGLDGGSENIRYNGSIGYVDDEGIGLATGFSKFSVKSNAEVKVTKKLTASINANFQYTDTDAYANQRDAISRGLSAAPTQIAYYEDGSPALGYNQTSQTPLFYTYYTDNTSIKKHVSLAGNLRWEIMPGWTLSGTASYYSVEGKSSTFLRSNYYDQSRPATSLWDETRRLKTDAYTQYKKTVADVHSLDFMAGFSWQDRRYEKLLGEGYGGSSDKISTLDAASVTTSSSTINEDAQMGFFARANYEYDNKYLLTLVARYDASSKFMKDNRWGFFPGVSAGWIVTEEPWMKQVKRIDYLKARVSLGQTGNNNIGINEAMGKYTATYTYNGNAAIRGTTMPNANLFWETTTQLDAGFEIGLLRNRIYLTADYYDKYTDNLLYDMSLPNTSGYSKVTTNLGTVRYWGFEFELTTKNIERDNFSWETKLVYSLNKNVVVKLPDNGMACNRTGTTAYPIYSNGDGTYFGGLAEGEPLYRFYGYKAIGIYQTDEEASHAPFDQLARGFNSNDGTTSLGRKFAGDYNWADRNGDGVITKNQDLFCLGVTEPPITGGINNTFKIGRFSVDLFMDYAIGHSIHDDSFGRYFYATFSCNYALAEAVKECWKQPGDVTRYAKFWANDSGAGQDNFNRDSNIFTYRADYLCLRELSVRYDVSKALCSKLGMSGLQLSLSGNNLYYLTAVKGVSPEIGTSTTYDASYANYPPTRRISFGVKVKF